MISECKSGFLIKQISIFLLGDDTAEAEVKGEKRHQTREMLISRCDHISDELSIATLRLFEVSFSSLDFRFNLVDCNFLNPFLLPAVKLFCVF